LANQREALAAFLLRLRSQGITNHRLLSAFEAVPRRNFVPVIHVSDAYARGQMPIECGQSMTAADHVARTLSHLDIESGHRVLELGTGTGYQTALLATLASKVTTIERFRTLHEKAQARWSTLDLNNIVIHLADATHPDTSWGVFDRVISNFAFEITPKNYLDLIVGDGVLIAPIGPSNGVQMLRKHRKVGVRFEVEDLMEIRTQPGLTGISKAI